MGWKCQCKANNFILNTQCYCGLSFEDGAIYRTSEPNLDVVIYILNREEWSKLKHMTSDEKIELQKKYFNEEMMLISEMNDEQILVQRNELASIIFESRARMNAHDENDRVKRAKKTKDGKSWLIPSDSISPNITDGINAVKERKKKMSREDKLKEQMKTWGIQDTDEILGKIESRKSNGSVNSSTSRTHIPNVTPAVINTTKDEKPNSNTQESLAADSGIQIQNAIKGGLPMDLIVKMAITAGHIGNKVLNQPIPKFDPKAFSEKLKQKQQTKE
jgi:hypothetical protein